MIRCANERCSNDPSRSPYKQVVSIDGDMVCCEECRKQHEKDKESFFNNIVHDPAKTENYLWADK